MYSLTEEEEDDDDETLLKQLQWLLKKITEKKKQINIQKKYIQNILFISQTLYLLADERV